MITPLRFVAALLALSVAACASEVPGPEAPAAPDASAAAPRADAHRRATALPPKDEVNAAFGTSFDAHGVQVGADTVDGPSSSTTTGFFVQGGDIYDPSGRRFLIRGVNHTHWWGDQEANLLAVDELPKTGVNMVRAVFGPDFGVDTPEEKREVVERYVENGLPVMVEDHRGTCDEDPATIAAAVDEWTHPANV